MLRLHFKKIAVLYRSFFFVASIALLALIVFPAAAQLNTFQDCSGLGIADCSNASGEGLAKKLGDIINVVLTLVGVVALGVVIYGGVQYILSSGDDKKADQAKHTILYAVIGLIVIGLSAVIINFVIGAIAGDGGGGGGNNPPPSSPPGGSDESEEGE